MTVRKSDDGVVPMKSGNADRGKAITRATALWGNTNRAQ